MVALMVCSLLAAGQPPAEKPKPVEVRVLDSAVTFQLEAQKPDDLSAALANHPDVQIAEAKVRIAQAELNKAKLLAAQQITTAQTKVKRAQEQVERYRVEFERVRKLPAEKRLTATELEDAVKQSVQVNESLAVAEADLRAVSGVTTTARYELLDVGTDNMYTLYRRVAGSETLSIPSPPAGSTADKLRALMTKTVKLAATTATPADYLRSLFTAGGSDLLVQSRLLEIGGEKGPFPAGEKTVSAWLEQFQDMLNGGLRPEAHCQFYVREYGLLFCAPKDAPRGAVRLTEFLRQPVPKQ